MKTSMSTKLPSLRTLWTGNGWGKRFVLIEAGVIRGGNYTWITDVLKNIAPECEFTTLTMYENVHSKYQSDIVGNVYDNEVEDLHFWWERPNNHWTGR